MAFSNAENFQIDRSTFNDAQGDINYRIQRNYNHHIQGDYFNQHIDVHGEQDTRSRVHLAMKDHIHTDAFHDSGARRDPSRCYPGTREAALETISHWTRDPASHCLWLHGPAGTGKSAIAQTFAEQCHQDGTLGASYFFTKGSTNGLARGPPPLFSTIAYQLMSVFPGLDDHLLAVIHADRTIFKRSLSAQLDKLIVQPLLTLASTSAPTVVIVDGLDECDGDSTQGEIVQLILGLEHHLLPILFLISSRPEPVIRRAFESFPRPSLARLPLDKTLYPDRDIHHFLVNEFERIYQQSVKMGMPPVSRLPWPSPEDIGTLVCKSSGHFVYAATVIRFVQEDHAHPMDRLDAILRIPSEFASSSTTKGIFSNSIAFQELDSLYLHILRKYRSRGELVEILHAIMHFGYQRASTGYIETIFDLRPGSICIMLEGLHSIIDVPVDNISPLRFLHASFSDFLADPERSHEFHLETSHFNAELACAYMRLIVAFSLTQCGRPLSLAMEDLGRCLKATGGLLSDTLEKLTKIITQESTPPCLLYIILDFLQAILKEFPEAEAEHKHCETILERLEPQLVGLSGEIFTILRILGAGKYLLYMGYPRPEGDGWLIGVPNSIGEEVFKQILKLNYYDLTRIIVRERRGWPLRWVYESLYRLLLAYYRPSMRRPTYVAVHEYTWAWAWDTYVSRYSSVADPGHPDPDIQVDLVHGVDLIYGCLRLLLLELSQPLDPIPPPIFQRASQFLARACWHIQGEYFDFVELIESIDFTPMLRALPDPTTTFCPRLFYLHRGLDPLYHHMQIDGRFGDSSHGPRARRPIPRSQEFLETIYSRLLQDPLASRIVPVVYAMFCSLLPQDLERLLGLAPGVLCRSAAIQGLFGAGPQVAWDTGSFSLGLLLKVGSVKVQSGCIDDYMRGAHEYLAISCAKHLESCTDAGGNDSWGSASSYAKKYWSNHLRHAKPSERLFDMLRRVNINKQNIGTVIQWLEESPNVPKDVLARWHTARADAGVMIHSPPLNPEYERVCLLDQIFQRRCTDW